MAVTVRVSARRADGGEACFVATNPPTSTDIERLALLAAQPGLADATWTTESGASSR